LIIKEKSSDFLVRKRKHGELENDHNLLVPIINGNLAMISSNNCSPNIQSKPSSGLNSKNSRVLASGKRLKISDDPMTIQYELDSDEEWQEMKCDNLEDD
jgi:hypothetical protein